MFDVVSGTDFRKKIKYGIAPGQPHRWFFFGDEDYLKHAAVLSAKEALVADPSFDFDYIGSDAYSEEALISSLAAPPLFGELRLVVVSVSFQDLRPSEVSSLIDLIGDVDDEGYTAVILNIPCDGFDPGRLPRQPSAVFKKLCEAAVPVQFERVTGARLNGWVSKHYQSYGLLADASVCVYTVNYCGADMFRLSSEIEKISCLVLSEGRDRVTEADVRRAGCAVTEFDSFALTNAIIAGNHKLALEVLSYVKTQKTEPTKVMAEIIRVVCDMCAVDACRREGKTSDQIGQITGIKPFPLSKYLTALETTSSERLRATLEAARRADEKVKGLSKEYVPIEQLICSL